MRGMFAKGLGLSLGLLTSGAYAAELPFHRTPSPPVVIARSGKPDPARVPAASLGRPSLLPVGSQVAPRQLLIPVAYSDTLIGPPAPLVRAQSAEEMPRPLPVGTPDLRVAGSAPQGTPAPSNAPRPENVEIIPSAPRMVETGVPFRSCECRHPGPCCDSGICPEIWTEDCDGGCLWAPQCFWVGAEYLIWGVKQSSLPPLLTTSPLANLGRLNYPGTAVLVGDTDLDQKDRFGGRFTLGFWLDKCQTVGLEGSFLFLGERVANMSAVSTGTPLLARPYFDPVTGTEAAQLVAFPGLVSGGAFVNVPSRLWGGELNARTNLCSEGCCRLDLLAGLRYLELDEGVAITEVLAVGSSPMALPGALGIATVSPAGSGIAVSDRFNTRNYFYGGQVGLQAEFQKKRFFLDVTGKLALGCTHQIVDINGTTNFAVSGLVPVTRLGGLLAQPTNIGRYSRDEFAVVPELGLKLGYQFTPHLRAFVGYNVIYWSQVVRPGDQIDRVVNTSQQPTFFAQPAVQGLPRPTFAFQGTDFWTQGVTFGLEFQY